MLTKKFNLCFSKIKYLPTSLSPPSTLEDEDDDDGDDFQAYNSSSTTSSTTTSSPPDFSTTFASHRFFVSAPGQSNSILDSTELVFEGVSIIKFSPDPYSYFRESMQEMIRDRERLTGINSSNDCEYLQELLESYISLNSKQTRNLIIGAFADLIVSLMDSSQSHS